MAKDKTENKEEIGFFKKALFTGVGAFFMTEETIRQGLGELKLPQEFAKAVLKNAQKGKDEVLGIFRNEFHKVMQKYDVAAEMGKFLREHDMHVNIHFTRKK